MSENEYQRNPDGSWSEAVPIGWAGGIDFEVYGLGPYEWVAYDEDMCVGTGSARTKIGLNLALIRAKRRLS